MLTVTFAGAVASRGGAIVAVHLDRGAELGGRRRKSVRVNP
jgi:hypothetical protein